MYPDKKNRAKRHFKKKYLPTEILSQETSDLAKANFWNVCVWWRDSIPGRYEHRHGAAIGCT